MGYVRVALIKVGALGDVVRTTVLGPGLRRLNPNLDIVWITGKEALPIVSCQPDVKLAATVDSPPEATWRSWRYDWVISLEEDELSSSIAANLKTERLSGCYTSAGRVTYTPDLERWFGMGLLRPESEGGWQRANELKRKNRATHGEILFQCLGLPGPVPRPYIEVPAASRQWATDWIEQNRLHRPIVALNTAAGQRWRYKSWGEDQTAELARMLNDELKTSVIISGGPAEEVRNRRIVAAAGHSQVVGAPSDLGLLSFAALLEQSDVVVSSDSLALHLSTALGRPTVAFFGPTSAAEIDLHGLGEKVVTPLGCRTCYLTDCEVTPTCMESIPVRRMFYAVANCLRSGFPGAGGG